MSSCEIAVYGLGIMGSSLAKNFLGRGYRVSLFSKSEAERESFRAACDQGTLCATQEEMITSLAPPRVIFLMVTAGQVVDQVLEELTPLLKPGDVVIDGGNSLYKDTDRRVALMAGYGVHYLGVGVSGGEEGARKGPSMMAGGSAQGWAVCGPMLQAISAKAGDEPCCGYLGAGGAGHFVKMVHNGIEYAVLQLIADVYSIMKNGLGMTHDQTAATFQGWRGGLLDSYLLDITCDVLSVMDEDETPLVEKILDVAGQKGTGGWTLLDAVDKGVYIPTICESVFMRYFSGRKSLREQGAARLPVTASPLALGERYKQLADALLAGIICAYAQGIELMQAASRQHGWNLDMPAAISLWRAGCIIRSRLLPDLVSAVKEPVDNIILSDSLSYFPSLEPALREVVTRTMAAGVAIPTLASALSYYDCCRSARLPLNLVQALRDCFGAHTYQLVDRPGSFHTRW